MYIHEIGRIDALPYGAAATAPIASALRAEGGGGPGRNCARCAPTADRTDAGAAAAVRNAEGLVQVQVRDVGAELARRGEADQRIQVRAVDVHLAAVRVHDLAESP